MRKSVDPIAQFMQEHDEMLVQLSSLNKYGRLLGEHGYSVSAFQHVISAVEFLRQEVRVHNKSEEEALFPVLERYVEGPTKLMRKDHKELAKAFRRLERSMENAKRSNYNRESISNLGEISRSVVQLFVNHLHKENHILFPLVQKFLTKDALREVARRML